MRVLHVLANGPPDVNGYAVRTSGLLRAQSRMDDVEPVALTSPWYPERESMATPHVADGVSHHRCLHPTHSSEPLGLAERWVASRGRRRMAGSAGFAKRSLLSRAFQLALRPLRPAGSWVEERIQFRRFTKRIEEVARMEDAVVIHAHVPYRVGLPALRAARTLGLPFVYEMRGMWEESAVASGRWRAGGLAHRRFRRLETGVLRAADAVVCISETLRAEAISRGVDPARITVVPNAIEITDSEVPPGSLHQQLERELGDALTVGYIGSLRELEGVDRTAEAVATLHAEGLEPHLLVLSSEAGQAELNSVCDTLGIAAHAHIVGPVPHEEVGPFYDLIDVFVVSRPDTRVTRLVTPLKPFEAMGRGRAVVVSNLPALAEIIEDGLTGRLAPPDDVEALAGVIRELLEDPAERDRLGQAARAWVHAERGWDAVTAQMGEVYMGLRAR